MEDRVDWKMEARADRYKDRVEALASDIARIKAVQHKIEEKMTTVENAIDQIREKLAEIKRGGD